MFLVEPPRTQWDLHFELAGIPVRIHPLFWLMALLLGASLARDAGDRAGVIVLIWVSVVVVSILVHEFGHALVMRYFKESPRVVLYMMGGLAIADSSPYAVNYGNQGRNTREQIIISAAGPIAGFLFAALAVGAVYAFGGAVVFHSPIAWGIDIQNLNLAILIHLLLVVNIFWGLINLLPVDPLDGGQIARAVFVQHDPWNGLRRSLWVSVIAGGAAALAGILFTESFLMAILFGSMAFSSYMSLQQMQGGGGFGGGRPW